TGEICFDEHTSAAWANLYIRLPEGLNVKSVDPGSKAVILPDGIGLQWNIPRSTVKFSVSVGL
ncbi:MAG: hypothetical protein ABFD10_00515, partial [Prolixibacteraceae bacterium]